MENMLLYVRVSTKEQQEKGFSLQAQENQLRNTFKNFNIIHIIHDTTSGTKLERTGLTELQGWLHKIKFIGVTEIDRLARDLKIQGVIEYWCKPYGIKIIAVNQPTENEFITEIHSVVAKKENVDRLERIRRAKEFCFQNGRHIAKPPFGYIYDKNSKPSKLVFDRNIGIVKNIFKLRLEGNGYLKIAKRLEFTSKNGSFAIIQIKKIISNPFYAGIIQFKDRYKKGIHEQIISIDDFLKLNPKLKQYLS